MPRPVRKAHENGAGEEVHEEAEAHEARDEQQRPREQGGEPSERQPLGRIRRCQPGQPSGKDHRRCRISADDEVPRRPKQGEERHRDQKGVEPGGDRGAGEARVAHHLRDRERGQGGALDGVGRQLG